MSSGKVSKVVAGLRDRAVRMDFLSLSFSLDFLKKKLGRGKDNTGTRKRELEFNI